MKVTVKKKDNSVRVEITTEYIKLQDALKFANVVYSGGEAKTVILELTNGLSPIVLTPAEDKYDFAYMVLPVRIKNG